MSQSREEQDSRRQCFVQAVANDDDEAAEAAARTLLPADEAWLLEIFSDDRANSDVDQRWWAVRALAACGGSDCVPAVIRTLDDADATVRAAAVLALSYLHGRVPQTVAPAFASMVQLLADDEGSVRQTTTDALAMVGDPAVSALASVLAGENPAGVNEGARSRATAALRKIGSMAAAGVLFRYLNDPNYLVRSYAYEALDEMGLLETQLLIL